MTKKTYALMSHDATFFSECPFVKIPKDQRKDICDTFLRIHKDNWHRQLTAKANRIALLLSGKIKHINLILCLDTARPSRCGPLHPFDKKQSN